MMIRDNEQHQRVIYVAISRDELTAIIIADLAQRLGVNENLLRKHGKVDIETNFEGSPQYPSGHKASFRATISLEVVEKEDVG